MAAVTFIPDELLDLPLDDIIANGDLVHLTPDVLKTVSYAEVVAASIGNYVPSITKSDLATGGRKATLAASAGVFIDTATNYGGATQTFSQYIIVDTVNSKIKFIGIGTDKLLSDGDTVNTPASEIKNPDMVVA